MSKRVQKQIAQKQMSKRIVQKRIIPKRMKLTKNPGKPAASVILRYSNKSQIRLQNLKLLLSLIKLQPNIEIILSVMENDIPAHVDLTGIRKIFTPDHFESSKANNIGANAAKTDIFIFQDADIVFRLNNYAKIIEAIKSKYESVLIGRDCVNLGGDSLPTNISALLKMLKVERGVASRDAPGGCSAISRKAFIRVGGHCELFKVYGWEDCYYRYKVQILTEQIDFKNRMYHLNHEMNYQAGHQADNAHLYSELLTRDNGTCLQCATRDRNFLSKHYEYLK